MKPLTAGLLSLVQGGAQGLLLALDRQSDDEARGLLKAGLLKIASSGTLGRERARRLTLLLAEAASAVVEELK